MATRPELLSPAGDMERLNMALTFGANAVYLSGTRYGMRGGCANFDEEALRKADSALLEPMMKIEVVVPDDYMGDVMGDISARRGRVTGMDAHAGLHSIDGIVPLSEMFGYATDLRSKTQGRGNYTMQFAHYEEVPHGIADKILGRHN